MGLIGLVLCTALVISKFKAFLYFSRCNISMHVLYALLDGGLFPLLQWIFDLSTFDLRKIFDSSKILLFPK